ncbi:hypothetical protein FRC01_010647, partial [Tulasnella sp. 417]
MASSSSLSSVVSNLVRAQLGASVSSQVTDEDLDKHVADLILREAKQKEEKSFGKEGVRAYYPDEPENKPRPNKRFLSAIIKTVDEHNAVVIETQARIAASAKEAQEEEERRLRRARANEAAGDRLKRLMGGGLRAERLSDRRRSRSPDSSKYRSSRYRGTDSDYDSRERDSLEEDARRRTKGKGKERDYGDDEDESRRRRSKRDSSRSRERSPLESDREKRRRSRSRSPGRRHRDDGRSSRRRSRSGDEDRHKRRRRDDERRSASPVHEDRSKRRRSRSRSRERRRRDTSPGRSSRTATPQATLATNSAPSSQQHPLAKSTVPLSHSPSPEPDPSVPIPSKMDKYFDPAYDPMLDVETPATQSVNELIPEGAFDHWNAMLEL